MSAGAALRAVFGAFWKAVPSQMHAKLLPHVIAGANPAARLRAGVPTLEGVLENLRNNGFRPATVVDCGAYHGEWSRTAAAFFPQACYVLLEADAENRAAVERAARECGQGSRAAIVLLGPEPREGVTFHRMGTGSSVMAEVTGFERTTVALSMTTLDDVAAEAAGAVLLKLDVQGFELEVLRGGLRTLARSEVVILEAALLPFNEGAPLFAEVTAFLDQAGFAVYDFCGQFRRQTDHALFQTDVVFVRRDSRLRARRRFWLNEPS